MPMRRMRSGCCARAAPVSGLLFNCHYLSGLGPDDAKSLKSLELTLVHGSTSRRCRRTQFGIRI
jgi:hypothetical protein